MMTLSEAIEHAEWAANNCEGECADEHRQLAEWLMDLRKRQLVDDALEDERNLLFERLGDYGVALGDARTENAKLRELCAGMMKALRRAEGLAGMDALVGYTAWYAPKLHDLGIEVD